MGMKVYPTHEDRRAILERRLEIAQVKNTELRAENADIKASLAAMADLMDEQAEHLGGENERLKAANQALREALAPFARIHDEECEAGNLDGTSSSLELWIDENDLERAAHILSVVPEPQPQPEPPGIDFMMWGRFAYISRFLNGLCHELRTGEPIDALVTLDGIIANLEVLDDLCRKMRRDHKQHHLNES